MFCDNTCLLYLTNLIIFIVLTKVTAETQQLRPPATDFNKHRLVQPILHHGRTKRELPTTRDASGVHHSEVTVTVPIDGQEYVLDLRLNHGLVTDNHVLSYQKNGKTIVHRPSKKDVDLCQYSGTVRDKPGSWVAVSTCRGVRGIVFDGKRMRYIEPAEGSDIQSNHYIYDHSDLNNDYNCGYVGGVTQNASFDPQLFHKYHSEQDSQRSRISRYKRHASSKTQDHVPYNANKLSRYVELVLVADNRLFIKNRGNIRTVHRHMMDIANIINALYTPLNIFIALVGVEVWTKRDEIILDRDGDKTLDYFVHYRKTVLENKIPNDNAHLLTLQDFKDSVVGKAYKGSMCGDMSAGVINDHSAVVGLVAATLAHEMGHNFGMDHDDFDKCQCPGRKCIMNGQSTSVMPLHWSSCSLNYLTLSFEKGLDFCLRNAPKSLCDSPTCGNGFVEPGEQCDCGTMADPRAYNPCHACCNPDTCMLRANATCGAGMCCDLQSCRPRAAGWECRAAERECDLPEYCSGHSEYCPDDVYKMDTTPCGKGEEEAYCVRGSCRAHNYQCRLLWGIAAKSQPQCYELANVNGNKYGDCGFDKRTQRHLPCARADVMCGRLQCTHYSKDLQWGPHSRSHSWRQNIYTLGHSVVILCSTAILESGSSDLGLVPDGAKCGDQKMCMSQRCVSVAAVRERIASAESSVCPSNCSGHGVCNSLGHCHCAAGFAPPLCALPGPGGSYDSGPATDPTTQHNFMAAMYVIFLGITPFVAIILLLYYSRRSLQLCFKEPHLWTDKFQNSSSSLRKLFSFKNKEQTNIYTEPPATETPIYSNLEELRTTQKLSNNIVMPDKCRAKKSLKNPVGKINKDDIQIVNNVDINVSRPLLKPKPNTSSVSKENKPNVVIVKQGLASTTNEMVTNSQHRMHNVGNSELYANVMVQK